MYDLVVLSLGAGVQSTTLALMADRGMITPQPTDAIFADTRAEPRDVYEHLDWLESELRHIRVHRVSNHRSLKADVWDGVQQDGKPLVTIPVFLADPDGIMKRQCTVRYKIEPIKRRIRELMGLGPRQSTHGKSVLQYLGISLDEAIRVRDSDVDYIDLAYPLVERRMSRIDCLDWFSREYPGRILPRSACVFCPYHTSNEWARLRQTDPAGYAFAESLDRRLRYGSPHPDKSPLRAGRAYLHRSRRPLAEAMATYDASPTLPGFEEVKGDECAGVCFV